ncbi:MAG: hypothetical protein QOK26_3691 [Pseudonocardiales bacterium]|nr:hypothetical protein [Pseudonocardiales bacterium]
MKQRKQDGRSRLLEGRNLAVAAVIVVLLGGGLWLGITTRGSGYPQAPPSAAPPAAPAQPGPASTINLVGWKLTIPEAGKKGNAAIIQPASTTPPWLTANPGGSLTFWAPVVGATTKNSDHPRTELDSLNNFEAGTGPHTLTASLAVTQVPSDTKDIIIGQIHGADSISSVPYVMLHYQAGAIRVVVKKAQDSEDGQTYQLISGIPLGGRFDFTISDVGNGGMVFSATYGGQTKRVTAPIPATFQGETVRFQVGDYQVSKNSEDPADGGRVTYYAIDEGSTAP